MQQVQTKSDNNQYTCCFLGHERENIIGFCLFNECQDPIGFCTRCASKQIRHEGHWYDYLFGFNELWEILDECIAKLDLEKCDFEELYKWINESQKYIDKQLFGKSEKPIQKLQKIKENIDLILKLIQKIKSLFTQSQQSLQELNYQFFKNNIKQLRRTIFSFKNYNVNQTITLIKQKQMQPFQNLKNANLRILTEKLTQIYFLKIIDSCNSLGFKYFSNFLRIEVQLEVKNSFDQIIIRNQQVTLSQIWNTLRGLEKLYKASIFDDKTNSVHQNDLLNQEQILTNKNQMQIYEAHDVITFINEIIRLNPNNELFSCIESKFLEVNRNYKSSIRFIGEVIRLDPQNANLYNKKGEQKNLLASLGIFLHLFGKLKSSCKSFDKAIELSPNNPIYYINQGISLSQLGDYDNSIIHFNQAKILEVLNLQAINQYTQRINNQIRNDNKIYQFPLKIDNQNLLKYDDAGDYFKQGNDLQNKGDYLNAILHYDLTIRLKPDCAKAYNDKGYSLHQLQKYEKAIQCYEKAIKLETNNAQYCNNKGNSLKRLSKYQDAVQCYNEAIRLKPDCADFYNNKGLCLYNMQEYKDANECYDEAIRLNPNFADYYNNKGLALSRFKHYELAVECFDKAISLQPDFADFNNNKGIQLVIYLHWLYPNQKIMKKLSDSLIKQLVQKQNLKIINRQVIYLQIRRNFVQFNNIVPFLLQQSQFTIQSDDVKLSTNLFQDIFQC